MEHKHAIVTNSEGSKIEFVLVEIDLEDGTERPYDYELIPGDQLVYDDVQAALAMYKPRWNGHIWEETATEEEIDAIEQARREEFGGREVGTPEPDPRDVAIAELTMAMATMQMQNDMAMAEMMMLMTGGM